jgi:large subunit ribosomal protein L1
MDKAQIKSAFARALDAKGSRKFTQTVDLGINFKGLDFTKQENRLNLDVALPKGIGKQVKIAVFADGQMALDAKNGGADLVIAGSEIPEIAGDQKRIKELLAYEFLAAPNLMAVVGKNLGQVLGTRGKLPKPIMGGSIADLISKARSTVRIKSKGKFLPVIHVRVGTEKMTADELADNAEAVLEKVKAKTGEHTIKNVFVKLTMGAPVYVGAEKNESNEAG